MAEYSQTLDAARDGGYQPRTERFQTDGDALAPLDHLRFVDLFAGLGGFHLALAELGHEAVFACEIDPYLRNLYEQNFDIPVAGDIREVDAEAIPHHDILCAGFPCQPFSKAGDQLGLDCPRWGDLFGHVLRIIAFHMPRYVILENVPNLKYHNDGQTWLNMKQDLEQAGYDVREQRLSPHRFGIPQVRERLYVVASRSPLSDLIWPEPTGQPLESIRSVLDKNPIGAKNLSPAVEHCLEVWQGFLDRFPKNCELPSFPIWSAEFGATYPFHPQTPFEVGQRALGEYLGSHGQVLADLPEESRLNALPSYARVPQTQFPTWKVHFIEQNRAFYEKHKRWIDEWKASVIDLPPSHQKLEWNCKGEIHNIWHFIIQFRASGVRVKRPTTSPSLVAMTTTQVPIVAWERRYMTPRECARLQSMDGLNSLPESSTRAFKALGNAVNVEMVKMIAKALLRAGQAERCYAQYSQRQLDFDVS